MYISEMITSLIFIFAKMVFKNPTACKMFVHPREFPGVNDQKLLLYHRYSEECSV